MRPKLFKYSDIHAKGFKVQENTFFRYSEFHAAFTNYIMSASYLLSAFANIEFIFFIYS